MSAPATPPIIIIKKKVAHGGHHGGAWKVAYADFVTAMMALFIVLWLLSASADVRKSIAGYFRDPKGFGRQTGSSMGGSGESLTITKSSMDLLKGRLEKSIKASPQFDKLKDYVQMTVTGEGLRIELLETEKGKFFESGQPVPTELARQLLAQLAKELGQMKNSIFIEGHTDAKAYDGEKYSNWELSADRANASRRIMEDSGLRPNQVTQIRGYADQQLRLPDKPEDPSNRRVSIIVQYIEVLDPEVTPASGKALKTDKEEAGEPGAASSETKGGGHAVPATPAREHGGGESAKSNSGKPNPQDALNGKSASGSRAAVPKTQTKK